MDGSRKSLQWVTRGEAIGSSRGERHYNVPGSRDSRLQHHHGNIEHDRALDQNEG